MSEVWTLSKSLMNRVSFDELKITPSSRTASLEQERNDLRSKLDEAERLRYEKWEMLVQTMHEADELRAKIVRLELRVQELESCLNWAGGEVSCLAAMLKEC
jgi:predicted  nucleic acid-binding Zn-ribbon protein